MDKDLTLILALISSGIVTLGSFFGTAKAFLEYLKVREETKRKAFEEKKENEKGSNRNQRSKPNSKKDV